jgi:thioredoxin 1
MMFTEVTIRRRAGVDADQPEGTPVSNLAAVTDADFEATVLKSDKPVLVDFWAEWCGPCHAVYPVLERVAEERNLKLVKVNIDENQGLATRYGVMSIPTMVLFKDGEPAAAAIGARPKGDLERQLGLAEVAA